MRARVLGLAGGALTVAAAIAARPLGAGAQSLMFYDLKSLTAPGYVNLACPPGMAPLGTVLPSLAATPSDLEATTPAFGTWYFYVTPTVPGQAARLIQTNYANQTLWSMPLPAAAKVSLALGQSADDSLAVLLQTPGRAPSLDMVRLGNHHVTTLAVAPVGATAELAPAGHGVVVAWRSSASGAGGFGPVAGFTVVSGAGAVLHRVAFHPTGPARAALLVAPVGEQSALALQVGREVTAYRVDAASAVHGPYTLKAGEAGLSMTALPGGRVFLAGARDAELWSLVGRRADRLWRRTAVGQDGVVWNGADLVVGGSALTEVRAANGSEVRRWDAAPAGERVWPLLAGPFGTVAVTWPADPAAAAALGMVPTLTVMGPTGTTEESYTLAPLSAPRSAPRVDALLSAEGGAVALSPLYPDAVVGWPLATVVCPNGQTLPVRGAGAGT